LKLATNQGHARAQYIYERMLYHDESIPMTKSLAAHYFQLAADQGIPKI
jgi:TPR repeat protein